MRFSFKALFIGFTILTLIVGGFFSKIPLLMSMMTLVMISGALLALAISIASQPGVKRQFNTGFAVMALGTLFLSRFMGGTVASSGYDSLATLAVAPMLRAQSSQQTFAFAPPIQTLPLNSTVTFPAVTARPAPYYNVAAQTFVPLSAPQALVSPDIYRNYFMGALSILLGFVGGVSTVFILREKKEKAKEPQGDASEEVFSQTEAS